MREVAVANPRGGDANVREALPRLARDAVGPDLEVDALQPLELGPRGSVGDALDLRRSLLGSEADDKRDPAILPEVLALARRVERVEDDLELDRKSTRLNSSHL